MVAAFNAAPHSLIDSAPQTCLVMVIHLSLPSNPSHREYFSNANDQYKTRLEQPLLLTEGECEVGLLDIHVTNS